MFKKSIHLCLAGALILTTHLAEAQTYAEQIRSKLSNPLLHQGLVNQKNYNLLNRLSQNYPKQNTLNVGWLSVFRRYNSGETVQNRTALATQAHSNNLIFDMDGESPLDWSKVSLNSNNEANFSEGQYVLSVETSNIEKENSPVLLLLLSNQHVANDYLSNPAAQGLAKLGYTVVTLEYPNCGASLGRASLQSWLSASRGAVRFLNQLTGKKIFIVGHSIGGPLSLQAAADNSVKGKVGGVITYGGFSDLYEMSKDQQSNPIIKFFSKPITYLTLKDNIIDGIGNLETLAKNQIPVLIMHGKNDGAVTSRNLDLYQDKIESIKRYSKNSTLPVMKTVIFNDLYHEEINNLSSQRPEDFYKVWNEVSKLTNPVSPNGQKHLF